MAVEIARQTYCSLPAISAEEEALIDGQPPGIHNGEFSPSEQAVTADAVVVDLPFLLSIVVTAQERDTRPSVPGCDGASPNLIETQAARLRTSAPKRG
jgi:hypothetical protein